MCGQFYFGLQILVPTEMWGVQRRAMIVGLGAGLLPMFVYNHIPVDIIQVLKDFPGSDS